MSEKRKAAREYCYETFLHLDFCASDVTPYLMSGGLCAQTVCAAAEGREGKFSDAG